MVSGRVIHSTFVTEHSFHSRVQSCISLAQAPHTSLFCSALRGSFVSRICFLSLTQAGGTPPAGTPQKSPGSQSRWATEAAAGGGPCRGPGHCPALFPVGHLEFRCYLNRSSLRDPSLLLGGPCCSVLHRGWVGPSFVEQNIYRGSF